MLTSFLYGCQSQPKSQTHILYLTIPLILCSQISPSLATLMNRTIDDSDTFGDMFSGSVLAYGSSWVSSSECDKVESIATQNRPMACGLLFSRATTSNRTWHSLVGEGSMSIQFNGSAIYPYFILPSHLLTASKPVLSKVGTNVSFILDGNVVPNYLQMNSYGVMQYHVPTLSRPSLSAGVHNLTIRNEGTLLENNTLLRTALVFDFAEYTVNNEVNSLQSGPGVLELGIAAGFGVLCFLFIAFFFLRLRSRSRQQHPSLDIDSWKSPLNQVSTSINSELVANWMLPYQKEHVIELGLGAAKIQRLQTQIENMRAQLPVEPNQHSAQALPTGKLRRGSASRLEAGVGSQNPNSLGVSVKKAITLNAFENRESGMTRRRSTLSRLGIPLRGSTSFVGNGDAAHRLELPEDPEQQLATGSRRRRTVGQQAHASPSNNTGNHDAQDDRALISRLQAEIRMLREEREVRLDLERFGFGTEYHGEELPDYDSVV